MVVIEFLKGAEMIEVKRKVKKEVEETVTMDLIPFWMVRIVRIGEYTNAKVVIAEKEFSYEPNEQEIADLLIDYNNKYCFASVIKNYRLEEVEEQK